MNLAVSLLVFSLITTPQGYNDRRIIVITASEHDDSKVKNQIDRFQKKALELEERKLAVYTLIDGEVTSIMNSSKQSKDFVEDNKAEYTTTSDLKIHLIGLDTSVKETFEHAVEPQEIFDIVDSMPMRRAEMRRNKN